METNINDIRKTIINNIKDNKQNLNINPELEAVMFLDSYKEMNYKKITSTLSKEEMDLVPAINSVLNGADLHNSLEHNLKFFEYMTKATLEFDEKNELDKRLLIKALSQEDKENLLSIVSVFQEELDTYDRILNLEDLYKHYSSKITLCMESKGRISKDIIIQEITSFLKKLSCFDKESFIYIVLKLSVIDYKFMKYYLKNDWLFAVTAGCDNTKKRMNILESSKEEDIINFAIEDNDYLYEIVYTYINTREKHTNINGYEKEYAYIDGEDELNIVISGREALK